MRFLDGISQVAPTEAVGKFRHQRYRDVKIGADTLARVLELVERRPCTAADISASLGIALEQATVELEAMAAANKLTRIARQRGMFYAPPDRA